MDIQTETKQTVSQDITSSTNPSSDCVSTFNKTVLEFVEELKKTFPELEDIVDERYASLSTTDDSVMKWFELNAKDHHMALTTKDDTLFKKNQSLFLLPDINFSQLWKCKITKANKNAVWKYLHVLLLLVSHNNMSTVASTVEQRSLVDTPADDDGETSQDDSTQTPDMQKMFEQWNAMLDDKELSEDQLKNMKEQSENIMRLMQSLNQNDDEEDDATDASQTGGGKTGDGKNPFAGMENDPFMKQLENSKIAQFAKELSEELQMKDLGLSEEDSNINSFQDVFGMMGKNPHKLLGLVKTVGDKIQNKMQKGDIQQTELVSEAQGLMQSMTNSDVFKNMFKGAGGKGKKGRGGGGLDPQALFQNLAKNMNLDPKQFDPAMMQNMMSQMQQSGAMPQNMFNPHAGNGTTRARLQHKLAQKQQHAVGTNPKTASNVETSQTASNASKRKKKKKNKTKSNASV